MRGIYRKGCAMTKAQNGFNPLRWNCEERGCFNLQKRPKIEVFSACFRGKISFGDVDGIVEISGNFPILIYVAGLCFWGFMMGGEEE